YRRHFWCERWCYRSILWQTERGGHLLKHLKKLKKALTPKSLFGKICWAIHVTFGSILLGNICDYCDDRPRSRPHAEKSEHEDDWRSAEEHDDFYGSFCHQDRKS